ncbi:hypothetical protein BLA29_012833, partial [Euroglyphus maynei]
MGRKFTAIVCLVLIGTNAILASPPSSKGGDDSFEDSGEIIVQQQKLNRPKRGGYIEKPAGY